MLAQGNVEMWLGQLLQQSMNSLHGVIRDAFVSIQSPSFELLGEYMHTLYNCTEQIMYSVHVYCTCTCVLCVNDSTGFTCDLLFQIF